ncbi:hypothetical protein [Methylobacterium planeticum]|uniref:Uncharacterized protein n=1 Tax=Methylobacterium planeticum TaxID=2615211 RepID=A0A6N6MSB6_9HYPH|nr:hypothetical protein [Methylobacterium planeticum]KAB1073746.1 hypothetical protein F6X51_11210 [Methylobacterium planeticum]
MSMYYSVTKTQKADQPLNGIDELVGRIRQLVRHRGYERDKIVSAMLRRYLPNMGGAGWNGEASLRQVLTQAKLDQKSIDHLSANVVGEIHMAHERLAG